MHESLDRFVREREAKEITGLSRTTRWRLERTGRFPKRHSLSDHAKGYLLSELQDWMRERADARAISGEPANAA